MINYPSIDRTAPWEGRDEVVELPYHTCYMDGEESPEGIMYELDGVWFRKDKIHEYVATLDLCEEEEIGLIKLIIEENE